MPDVGPGTRPAPGKEPQTAAGRSTRVRVLAAYKQMLISLFSATILVIILFVILVFPFFYESYVKGRADVPDPALLFIVVLAGALGALFSALIRLYNYQDLPKAIVAQELEGLPKSYLLIYSLVPVVVGAISASVLYMLFAGGLVQGDLFPLFKCKSGDNKCNTFGLLITQWGPDQARDYAKAIVWGFIAGFAERLVPDTLQGLSKSAQDKRSQGDAEPAKAPVEQVEQPSEPRN